MLSAQHLVHTDPNRQWPRNFLFSASSLDDRPRTTLIPYIGCARTRFLRLRAVAISTYYRCVAANLSVQFNHIQVLDHFLELVFLGYPVKLVRPSVHSLPVSDSNQLVRKTIRLWSHHMASIPQHHSNGAGPRSQGGNSATL